MTLFSLIAIYLTNVLLSHNVTSNLGFISHNFELFL